MPSRISSEVISSESRLLIADLLSRRPRTLKELSRLSGISVQAVLKHLDRLKELGMIEEQDIRSSGIRKVYAMKNFDVRDFSLGDLTVVRIRKRPDPAPAGGDKVKVLESLASDTILLRRRVKEQARRLDSSIEELSNTNSLARSTLESLPLEDADKLALRTYFTEETTEDAVRSLERDIGFSEGRRSIERALAKAKRVGREKTGNGD